MFGFEIHIMKAIEGLRTDFWNGFFEAVTMFGEELLMILLVAILYFAIDKHLARRLFFVTTISVGVNSIIKNIAKIPRPFASGEVTCVRPETATGYSFPSGHTQSFATWSTAGALRFRKRWFTVLVCVMILLVAFSRVFLGAHYPSDVIVGVLLGIAFAVAGDFVYDKVENKQLLYWGVVLFLTPFVVYFLFDAEPLYADLYKLYGMAVGFPISVWLEERFAPLSYDVPWWKKALRVVIAVVLSLALKEGIKLLIVFEALPLSFFMNALRYLALVVTAFGLCPILYKKLKL